MIQRQFELEQTINIANKANDANSYYSAVFKLFSKDFYKDTVKLVDKGEYSWLIDKSMESHEVIKAPSLTEILEVEAEIRAKIMEEY